MKFKHELKIISKIWGEMMDGMDPEDYLIYNYYFEEEENNGLSKNESCCGVLMVLMILTILLTIA